MRGVASRRSDEPAQDNKLLPRAHRLWIVKSQRYFNSRRNFQAGGGRGFYRAWRRGEKHADDLRRGEKHYPCPPHLDKFASVQISRAFGLGCSQGAGRQGTMRVIGHRGIPRQPMLLVPVLPSLRSDLQKGERWAATSYWDGYLHEYLKHESRPGTSLCRGGWRWSTISAVSARRGRTSSPAAIVRVGTMFNAVATAFLQVGVNGWSNCGRWNGGRP
ncbi:hypothetical protein DFH06DRAFT_1121790 [Mycena polygramma]|nr:hypothetical protein DFH06DRAFT_1121790 [Mycena polygramma]